MDINESLESNVRFYCRHYTDVFKKAYGCIIENDVGKKYIDFFSGAGALNYGHNHPKIKEALVDYLKKDGISHSLDMSTVTKQLFINKFDKIILKPRNMSYKLQFCGPTGTNAVEAAIKLARKVTKRQNIITFTNAFHGVTLGSLSLTGSKTKRSAAGVSLNNAVFMPYDGYFGKETNTIEMIRKYLSDPSSGIDAPAAFIIETIQAEGGINVASLNWLQELQILAKEYNSLLIVDDIQVGCGRTGPFFSFEKFGLSPDLICLSKSLSAYGLPLSILLIKPEHDVWAPGEHNGTFRGHNLAFVTATEGLTFWENKEFEDSINIRANLLETKLYNIIDNITPLTILKGRGMIRGVGWEDYNLANRISAVCFQKGLIIETSGPYDQIIKFLPPLNIEIDYLEQGIEIFTKSVRQVLC